MNADEARKLIPNFRIKPLTSQELAQFYQLCQAYNFSGQFEDFLKFYAHLGPHPQTSGQMVKFKRMNPEVWTRKNDCLRHFWRSFRNFEFDVLRIQSQLDQVVKDLTDPSKVFRSNLLIILDSMDASEKSGWKDLLKKFSNFSIFHLPERDFSNQALSTTLISQQTKKICDLVEDFTRSSVAKKVLVLDKNQLASYLLKISEGPALTIRQKYSMSLNFVICYSKGVFSRKLSVDEAERRALELQSVLCNYSLINFIQANFNLADTVIQQKFYIFEADENYQAYQTIKEHVIDLENLENLILELYNQQSYRLYVHEIDIDESQSCPKKRIGHDLVNEEGSINMESGGTNLSKQISQDSQDSASTEYESVLVFPYKISDTTESSSTVGKGEANLHHEYPIEPPIADKITNVTQNLERLDLNSRSKFNSDTDIKNYLQTLLKKQNNGQNLNSLTSLIQTMPDEFDPIIDAISQNSIFQSQKIQKSDCLTYKDNAILKLGIFDVLDYPNLILYLDSNLKPQEYHCYKLNVNYDNYLEPEVFADKDIINFGILTKYSLDNFKNLEFTYTSNVNNQTKSIHVNLEKVSIADLSLAELQQLYELQIFMAKHWLQLSDDKLEFLKFSSLDQIPFLMVPKTAQFGVNFEKLKTAMPEDLANQAFVKAYTVNNQGAKNGAKKSNKKEIYGLVSNCNSTNDQPKTADEFVKPSSSQTYQQYYEEKSAPSNSYDNLQLSAICTVNVQLTIKY